MTEKRFEIYDEENGYVRDNKTGESYSACGGGDGFPFVIDEYHKLQKENEQLKTKNNAFIQDIEAYSEENTDLKLENDHLKQSYIQLTHRHSLLHDECLDAECDRDGYHQDVLSLEKENEKLKSENKRLIDKLNETALEFVNHYLVSMGKAVEISEMSYSDFLKFRKERGKPMELQE